METRFAFACLLHRVLLVLKDDFPLLNATRVRGVKYYLSIAWLQPAVAVT